MQCTVHLPGEWGETCCNPVGLLSASLVELVSLSLPSLGSGDDGEGCSYLAVAATVADSGGRAWGALKLIGSSMEGDGGWVAPRLLAAHGLFLAELVLASAVVDSYTVSAV